MLHHLQLRNVGPTPQLELALAPRLNLITGDNGLGKSFLLDAAWWALTRKWPRELNAQLSSGYPALPAPEDRHRARIAFNVEGRRGAAEYVATFDAAQGAWRGKAGRPPNPGLVLYALVDGGFAVWDPARNAWAKKGEESGPGAYVFDPRQVWDGLTEGEAVLCNGLVRDWASWQRERGAAFEALCAVLRALSPSGGALEPGALTRISLRDARDIPTLRQPSGQDIPILHASAGVRRVVALAYLLVWAWQEHVRASEFLGQPPSRGVVFLLDEVESHLHPRWQRCVLRSLLAAMEGITGEPEARVQVLAATHAPLVLASVEPWFDPAQDAWFDLDREAGEAVLRKRAWVRRGSAGSWLTSEAFDLGSDRSEEGEEAVLAAQRLLREGSAPLSEVMAVHERLRQTLPDVDRFWVRWCAHVERQGGTP